MPQARVGCGFATTYRRHGCRCAECTAAHARAARLYRARRRAATPPTPAPPEPPDLVEGVLQLMWRLASGRVRRPTPPLKPLVQGDPKLVALFRHHHPELFNEGAQPCTASSSTA